MDESAPPARRRILIVDDSLTMRHMLAAILKADYEVHTASSGAEGLLLAASLSPALILLDVVMPDLDGHAVLRRLKSDDRTARIPVVFVTGLDGTELPASAGPDAPSGYVAKPLKPEAVRAEVARHLSGV